MHNRECGLVVDGIWGESTIVFPFAVYEAKKPSGTTKQAEDQAYHALRTYLGMLDDLGRDPTDISKYQSKESERCQLFGFVSCGSHWFVYCAWHWLSNAVSAPYDVCGLDFCSSVKTVRGDNMGGRRWGS